jgi:sigma54-dependent transcription regulator
MDALRAADGALITTDEIASRGFDAADAVLYKAIGEQCLSLLRSFRNQQTVEQIGLGRGVRWRSSHTT